MDELTLRLECLRLACSARTGNDILGQAEVFFDYVTQAPRAVTGGLTKVQTEQMEAEVAKRVATVVAGLSANDRMNIKLSGVPRDKLGLTDAARRT